MLSKILISRQFLLNRRSGYLFNVNIATSGSLHQLIMDIIANKSYALCIYVVKSLSDENISTAMYLCKSYFAVFISFRKRYAHINKKLV